MVFFPVHDARAVRRFGGLASVHGNSPENAAQCSCGQECLGFRVCLGFSLFPLVKGLSLPFQPLNLLSAPLCYSPQDSVFLLLSSSFAICFQFSINLSQLYQCPTLMGEQFFGSTWKSVIVVVTGTILKILILLL